MSGDMAYTKCLMISLLRYIGTLQVLLQTNFFSILSHNHHADFICISGSILAILN